jgi:hypothetical protein
MASDPLSSPVIVDGLVSGEKVAELLALGSEYPELDYKAVVDLSIKGDTIEMAKDIGAMQVRGGYILVGVDDNGAVTGGMDSVDLRAFDEANLVPKLLKYLPQPLDLRATVVEREGHQIVAVCVLPNPRGCALFIADGKYEKRDGREAVAFRKGDVFWRDGTRSVRMSQEGLEAVISRRIAGEKTAWFTEQQEIRHLERTELETAYESRRLGQGPLGTVNLDLGIDELPLASLELVREGDDIALLRLMNDASVRARQLIAHDDIEVALGELLDKLICLAATFLQYEQHGWFDRIVALLVQIYSMPADADQVRALGYSSTIDSRNPAPRVWLAVIERIYALGGFATRRGDWAAVKTLTVQLPQPLAAAGYERNWLRHSLTMASRAQHFGPDDGMTSLLALARGDAARLAGLRLDGVAPDSEEVLTSIAQFDVLSNLVSIGDARSTDGRVYYPNFARLRQDRIQGIVDRLLEDETMRAALFPGTDDELATALDAVGASAAREGIRYHGFMGWEQTRVGRWLANREGGGSSGAS